METPIVLNLTKQHEESLHVIVKKPNDRPKQELDFFSFNIRDSNRALPFIGSDPIGEADFLEVLTEFGLSTSIPKALFHISSDGKKVSSIKLCADPRAGATLGMPRRWLFTVENISCSLLCNNESEYIRVHTQYYEKAVEIIILIFQRIYDKILLARKPVLESKISVYLACLKQGNIYWNTNNPIITHNRPLSTIHLPSADKEKAMIRIQKFLQSKQLYERYGANWKINFLFEGASP